MKRCSYAGRYQAFHPPQCDHGRGCDSCRERWRTMQAAVTAAQDACRAMWRAAADRERDAEAVRNFERRAARAAVLAREDVRIDGAPCESATLATLAALASLDAERA